MRIKMNRSNAKSNISENNKSVENNYIKKTIP